MKKIIITIDGPAGSGKGRIAKYLSKKWKLIHLDSGVLYRRLSLIFLKKNVNFSNTSDLSYNLLKIKKLSSRNHKSLRSTEITKLSSKLATIKIVREFINKLQKKIVNKSLKKRGFVIDGRDIGSVVFKKADLKLYIEASSIIRAKRRHKQLIDMGEKSIYAKILKEIKLRDQKDKSRKNSPLVIPKGAHIVDNSEVFSKTIKQINKILRK